MRRRGPAPGRRVRLGGALLAVGLAALPAPAWSDRDRDLERLREAIVESRERVAAYERQQRSLLETVEALDRAAAELSREVASARRRAERASEEYRAVTAEAESIEQQLEGTRRAMSRRAVALYKSGDRAAVRMLFAAGGIREFLARFSALHLLLGRDAELLERHRAQSVSLRLARERTRVAAEASEQAAAELRERGRELAAERAAKKKVVARLHADRTRERSALVELEKAARALEETLASLRGSPRGFAVALSGPAFASLRRALPPPVDAPVSGRFGRVVDEEFFTQTFRKGVEYAAPQGTPVRAVAEGHVRFAGWFRGFGRMVILDHGDQYFTVSGHLSELSVEVGDHVAAGGVIGAVGDTGSLSGPQLYFEIREGSQPVDPHDWLRQASSR